MTDFNCEFNLDSKAEQGRYLRDNRNVNYFNTMLSQSGRHGTRHKNSQPWQVGLMARPSAVQAHAAK